MLLNMGERMFISEQSQPLCVLMRSFLVIVGVWVCASASAWGAEVPLELLEDVSEVVQQKSHGIRDEERPAINRLLVAVREADESQLQREAAENLRDVQTAFRKSASGRGYSLFGDLLKQPGESSGLAFTLRGHIRRLEQIDTIKEQEKARPVYEAWLFTEDSQGHPWLVLTTEIPADLAPGTDLNERVEVTGYFIKLATYQAQDARRVVPMFAVPRIHRVIIVRGNGSQKVLIGGMILFLLLGCFLWWKFQRDIKKSRLLRERLEPRDRQVGFGEIGFDELEARPIDDAIQDPGTGP